MWLLRVFISCVIAVGCCQGKVTSVDANNIQQVLSKQPLLLEFYAPWCRHCMQFEPQFELVGAQLTPQKFEVAKCDSSANAALTARFDVYSVPTIFLYRDNKIWKYSGPLLGESILAFATSDYQKESPLSFWSSPVGPMGISKGILISLGLSLVNLLPILTNTFGLPQWIGFAIIACSLAFLILLTTFFGVYLSVTHAKND